MTFFNFTAKLKAPPNGLLRHTGECREMISAGTGYGAGHIERASEPDPSDYDNNIVLAATTVWGLTLNICQ